MCGRFTSILSPELLETLFGVRAPQGLALRYNIAPTQQVLAVRRPSGGDPELARVRWGLIPSWARDPAIGPRLINARAETVAEKPSFRAPFRRHRCLVPASGFFEWQHLPDGRKQPFYIHGAHGSPLAFAGLWDHWQAPDGSVIESCAIITTSANTPMAAIHDRMPVILAPESYPAWLGPDTPAETLQGLLRPCADDLLDIYPVSSRVNSPRNDDVACIERVVVEAGGDGI